MDSKVIDSLDIHANSFLATFYDHPDRVMADPLLDTVQKRCILAAWASDAFAVEGSPWLRQLPGLSEPIVLSEIFSALRRLDDDDDDPPPRGGAIQTVVKRERIIDAARSQHSRASLQAENVATAASRPSRFPRDKPLQRHVREFRATAI